MNLEDIRVLDELEWYVKNKSMQWMLTCCRFGGCWVGSVSEEKDGESWGCRSLWAGVIQMHNSKRFFVHYERTYSAWLFHSYNFGISQLFQISLYFTGYWIWFYLYISCLRLLVLDSVEGRYPFSSTYRESFVKVLLYARSSEWSG